MGVYFPRAAGVASIDGGTYTYTPPHPTQTDTTQNQLKTDSPLPPPLLIRGRGPQGRVDGHLPRPPAGKHGLDVPTPLHGVDHAAAAGPTL